MNASAAQLSDEAPVIREGRVLTTAVSRVAAAWGLTNAQLGKVLGVSPASASRLREGAFVLERGSKAFELGQYTVRLFRSLDAVMGSDDEAARAWLRAENLDLKARPIDRIGMIAGLVETCDYVDAYRAPV